MKPVDTYTVKFWIKDSDGYLKQHSDSYCASGKDRHEEAIQHICITWKIKVSDVISCTYH